MTTDRGCRHSSVDLTSDTILLPRVWVPSTPSTLLSFIVKFELYLSCEKNKNKQKEAGFGAYLFRFINIKAKKQWIYLWHERFYLVLINDCLKLTKRLFHNFEVEQIEVRKCFEHHLMDDSRPDRVFSLTWKERKK